MPTQIKLGLLGGGARGRSHLRSAYRVNDQDFLLCENESNYPHHTYHDYAPTAPEWAEEISDLEVEVRAVMDPSEATREKAMELCGDHGDVPDQYESLEEFRADNDCDAVVVASPNDYHAQQSLALLEDDLNVLAEKPIATTLPDHDRLIDAADSSSGVYFVGFNLRSSPFYTRLKELLGSGTIGELGMISCRECRGHFTADYSFDAERSGGALLDKNCHDFDLYNWYAQSDPVRVSALGGQHVHTDNTDINDYSTLIVEYSNGVAGTLELCMYAPFGERTRMYELRGSEGILRAPNERATVDLFTRERKDRLSVSTAGGGHGGADVRQMKRFLRSIQGEAEPPATPTDAKRADAVALAGERAIEEEAIVELDSNYNLKD